MRGLPNLGILTVSGPLQTPFVAPLRNGAVYRARVEAQGLNPGCTEPGKKYWWDDWNGGRYPFVPKPYKYLYLAVGYAKERDTALVEVTGFRFIPERIRRDRNGDPCFCYWVMAIGLGRVVELRRKGQPSAYSPSHSATASVFASTDSRNPL